MILSRKLQLLHRRRIFRWLFIGVLGSRIGDTFSIVALSWLALQMAGPAGVSMVLLASSLPAAVAGPVAGALIDRFGARRCVVVENVVHAPLLFLTALLASTGDLDIRGLVVLTVVASLFSMATEVSQDVLLPRILDDDELDDGNSLLSAIWDSAFLVGPATAGLVVAGLGEEWALAVDGVTFVLMAAAGALLPGRQQGGATDRASSGPFAGDVVDGFRTLWRYTDVLRLTLVGVVILLTTGVMSVVLPVLTSEKLSGRAATFGLLLSLGGLASLIGTLTVTNLASRIRPGVLLPLLIAVRGLALLPLAMTGYFWIVAGAIALTNLAEGPYYPVSRSTYQRIIPDDIRGRAAGARSVLGVCGYPLGAVLGGLALTVWGSAGTVVAVVLLHLPLCIVLWGTGRSRLPRTDRADTMIAEI